jgi:hypothetical protein
MFGSNLALPRGGILSYEQALAKYNSIDPIRGRNIDVRPVAQRRNDNFTIRLNQADESVIIRLYQTDIITYHKDGTIELEPYGSKLTDDAVRGVLRGVVTPMYTNPVGPVLYTRGKYYRIPRVATLDKDFNLVSGSAPFTHYQVDKAKGAAALKQSGYKQFAMWLNTQLRLGIDPREGSYWGNFYPSTEVIRTLDQPEYYHDIARGMPRTNVDDLLTNLRRAVHKYYDTIIETELPFVENWRHLNSIRASQRQWA